MMMNDILALLEKTADEIADSSDLDYAEAKVLLKVFVGVDPRDDAFHHLVIEGVDKAETIKVRHIERNLAKLTIGEIGEALGRVAALYLAKEQINQVVDGVLAGLYFLRVLRAAMKVELSREDASVVWALHKLGKAATKEELLAAWDDVVRGSNLVDACVTPLKLTARLANLEELGCIAETDGRIHFVEQVNVEG